MWSIPLEVEDNLRKTEYLVEQAVGEGAGLVLPPDFTNTHKPLLQ
jgi:hypothetical protein